MRNGVRTPMVRVVRALLWGILTTTSTYRIGIFEHFINIHWLFPAASYTENCFIFSRSGLIVATFSLYNKRKKTLRISIYINENAILCSREHTIQPFEFFVIFCFHFFLFKAKWLRRFLLLRFIFALFWFAVLSKMKLN